ncbi:MAG: hypothetical protein Q4G69_02510 [Planctomycetia bacterium]|nr:hypothetical protein [Planctomycetia bacterium]
MAKHNPFAVFRRNQKASLAILTLFTMFSFILLGTMFQCLQVRHTGVQQGRLVYAKTKKYGELDQPNFMFFRDDLRRVSAFLEGAATKLMQEKEVFPSYDGSLFVREKDPKDSSKEFPVPLTHLVSLFRELQYAQGSSENIVNRWLVYNTALSRGFKSDEEAVRQYLSLLFMDRLTKEDLDYACSVAGIRNYAQLYDLFNAQIICERFMRSVATPRGFSGFYEQTMPSGQGNLISAPSENFDAFRKLNQKMKVEVAAYTADSFAKEIQEPSESELKEFYEKYKYVRYNPVSKDPGFHMPNRHSFQIVRGDLTKERLDAVSDAEIKAYYEKNRGEFKKPVPQAAPGAANVPGALQLPGADSSSINVIPENILSDVKLPASPKEEVKKDEKKPESKPANTNSPEKEKKEPAKDAPKSSMNENSSPFRLVAYEAEKTADKTAAPKKEEAKPAAKPVEAKKEEAKPAAKPVEVKKEEAKPAAAPAVKADDGYFSLKEVESEIRRKLASEKLEKEMGEIFTEMEEYSRVLSNVRANVSSKESLKKISLKDLAAKHGFSYQETMETVNGEEVPRLLFPEEAFLLKVLPEDLLQQVYSGSTLDFSPQKTELIGESVYVYWSNAAKSENLPEFEEAKPFVLKTWKKLEGFKLAKEAAEALADRARTEKKDLADAVKAESKPVDFAKTQNFTWYDFPMGPQVSRLSVGEIREEGVALGTAESQNKVVKFPGDEFYETAFEMKPKEIAVVPNMSEDRVFVIQMLEKDPADLLLTLFDSANPQEFYQVLEQSSMIKNISFYEDLVKELQAEAGFEWVVMPGEVKQ